MQHGPRGPMGPGPHPEFLRGPPPPTEDPAREKAIRSVFVANISFETTEEQLREVLAEVGPVVSLKLIYNPGTGRPRGFGFCEYEDGETALSAVRNLQGREVNGRPLRIDSATNAPGGEFRGGGGPPGVGKGPIEPPLHGPPVPPESAPEAITKAVASLPPEQMFELMKQMKWCIQHNPEETRQLLLHNPQLAYGLLQAQVVMRCVDLETAHNLLHRAPRGPPLHQAPEPHPLPPPPHAHHPHGPPPPQHHPSPPGPSGSPGEPPFPPNRDRFGPPPPPPPRREERYGAPPPHRGPPPGHPPAGGGHYGGPSGPPPPRGPHDFDRRGPPEADRRGLHEPDRRGPPEPDRRGPHELDRRGPHEPDRRGPHEPDRRGPHEPDRRGPHEPDRRGPHEPDRRGPHEPDRRGPHEPGPIPSRPHPVPSPSSSSSSSAAPAPGKIGGLTPQDQEKAVLIMQVLSLTDEQIQMLPPEQRNSILKLKEQIARSN